MRLFGTRFAILCMVVCAVLVLAGCKSAASSASDARTSDQKTSESASEGDASVASSPKIEGLKKDGVLTVGISTESTAPFITNTEGSLEGLDVDLGATLADELGLPVEFVAIDDVASALNDKCDVVMGVMVSSADGFDVTGIYAQTGLALFHHGEPAVLNVDDINGKTVGVQDESPAQVSLRLSGLTLEEVPTSTVNEAFDMLERGDVDFALSSATSGAYLSAWRDEIGFAGALEEPVSVGFAIPSGEGSVQTALRGAYERIKENGVLDEVRRNWLGNLPTLTNDSVISIASAKTNPEDLPKKPEAVTIEEVQLDAKDGSAAGANAVTMAEVQAQAQMGVSSEGQGQSSSYDSEGNGDGHSGGSRPSANDAGAGYTDYGDGGYYAESYGY